MEQINAVVVELESQIASIKQETAEAEAKGVFSYARSKSIRKAALEIAKGAKDLRTIALDVFKAKKGEGE